MTDTCAEVARHTGEPLAGTAPTALGWLLVEQPGAWGRDALTSSGLDPAVGAHLAERVAELDVRVQVVRRPGTQGGWETDHGRTVLLAHAGPAPWIEALTVGRDDDLTAIDPMLCTASEPPGIGRRIDTPIVLVCTHGRRDRCCASLGRPIADTLVALHPRLVWESSHIGGHRFAGNLVVLPEGLVYGGLDVADALETLSLHRAGRIDVAHLRGRSGIGRVAQAAEVHARRELGLDRLDEVTVEPVTSDGGELTVGLRAAGRPYLARMERRPLGVARRLSCGATDDDPEVVHLAALTPARP